MRRRSFGAVVGLAMTWVASAAAQVCLVPHPDRVTVIVDMDAERDGCQSSVSVSPGTTVVAGVAVYVIDTTNSHPVWAMGYLGGLDRGLSFGHTPTNLHRGRVADLVATPGVALNPGNTAWIESPPVIQKGFAGPEVQYFEFGAVAASSLPSDPAGPIFTVDIHLEDAQDQDVFAFHVLDMVTVWTTGAGGVFSTAGPMTLDTGGDAIPDGTVALHGIDPDGGLPVPPAAFAVDLVDGPTQGGPATIVVQGPIPTTTRSWSLLKGRFSTGQDSPLGHP